MESNQQEPVEQFLCPILGTVMENPVLAPDGYTYEKSAIEDWISRQGTSPITRQQISAANLVPNRALKDLIENMKGQGQLANIQPGPGIKIPAGIEIEKDMQMTQGDLNLDAFIDKSNRLRLSVGLPDVEKPNPIDIICVVDVSYSMGESCSGIQDGKSQYVELAYSLLDLIQHALKMIVNVLGPEDRMALVLFSNAGVVSYDFTDMTPQGKLIATTKINAITKQGSTNVYHGIKTAIDVIENRTDKKRNPSMLFFTDGIPNVSPAQGEIKSLAKLQKKMNITYPIHTMGFGQYDQIDSYLIMEIAKIFNGMTGYIPDPTYIGTVFVNTIANILTTSTHGTKLELKFKGNMQNSVQDLKYLDQFEKDMKGEGDVLTVNLGCIRFGQNLDLIVQLKEDFDQTKYMNGEMFDAKLTYQSQGQEKVKEMPALKIAQCQEAENLTHVFRFESINLMKNLLFGAIYWRKDINKAMAAVNEHYEKWKKIELEDEFYEGMIQTLQRQTLVSLQKEKYMGKWGKHQYRQTIRALTLQYKANFRDPCLAHFGGELFENISDKADDIFNNMPPPIESLKQDQIKREQSVVHIENQADFQNVLNNVNAVGGAGPIVAAGGGNDSDAGCRGCGCFTGNSIIEMRHGSTKQVRLLKPGDHIKSLNGWSTVKCLIRFETTNGVQKLCTLPNGLQITPGHPIIVGGKWIYPRTVFKTIHERCDAVYNIIVDKEHVAIINSTPVILFGHNYSMGILKHEYYGSQRVIDDLKKQPGWESGFIKFKAGTFQKTMQPSMVSIAQRKKNIEKAQSSIKRYISKTLLL